MASHAGGGRSCSALLAFVALALSGVVMVHAQSYDGIARARARTMFDQVTDAVRKNYYDPTFGGRDIEAHFKRASERLDQAKSMNQALGVIAQALLDLNDSHTFFEPPSRTVRVDYGWRHTMIRNQCYVVAVRPNSDAAAKGVTRGDLIVDVQGFRPSRSELWKMDYFYHLLSPQRGIKFTIQSAGGQPRTLEVASTVTERKRAVDLTDDQTIIDVLNDIDNAQVEHRFQKVGAAVIWQMPQFDLSSAEIDDVMNRKIRGAASLILDLRGNGGGHVSTLERLVSHFFDREVKIADLKGRKEMKPMIARKRDGAPFTGRIVVLIDSQSASASELFARVVQLEKRGIVIGDQSEGAVMECEPFTLRSGAQSEIWFAAYVTRADLLMADGKSLEHVGVTPDELVVPTPDDLAAGRDPVLARAAAIAGESLDAQTAGRLFPIEWRK